MTYQALYDKAIADGCSPLLADMLASRCPPGASTDREFAGGMGTLADQFAGSEEQLNMVVSEARRQGYNPNPNDWYNSALATSIGDPLAFVPPTGGKSHVRKVCQMRDMDCYEADGKVINRRSEYRKQPVRAKSLAPDLVERKAFELARDNPEKRRQTKQSLREEVIAKHGS